VTQCATCLTVHAAQWLRVFTVHTAKCTIRNNRIYHTSHMWLFTYGNLFAVCMTFTHVTTCKWQNSIFFYSVNIHAICLNCKRVEAWILCIGINFQIDLSWIYNKCHISFISLSRLFLVRIESGYVHGNSSLLSWSQPHVMTIIIIDLIFWGVAILQYPPGLSCSHEKQFGRIFCFWRLTNHVFWNLNWYVRCTKFEIL
jgi:hypothetical protein